MKNCYILIAFFLVSKFSISQIEKYSKVQINGSETLIQHLLKLGITIDHSEAHEGQVITEISEKELSLLIQNKIEHKVLIDDLAKFYEERIKQDYLNKTSAPQDCNSPLVKKPTHFHLGSMGGYFTLSEMQAILDSMTLLFPHLISAKQALSPQSIEGRNIWYLKISDNPNTDEPEPEVLYSAVHHAREAASLSQLIFYMWYLLENYATNPEIKYLVDNTELYFVPCLNPDGYVYNQTTNPNGGGMWRKNRRNNGTSFGVDLNRNYGDHWGYDNSGSSPNPSSDTYRGTGPFSEPETQAMRNFCNARQFKTALNAHTYGNLLIYPWGYIPSFYTPDSATFVNWTTLMTETSRFLYGTGDQTVNYVVNGDSDDWMYGEQTTKPKILSMTPEAGSATDGFWPASSRIIDICKTTFNQNLNLAKLVTNYAIAKDEQDHFLFGNGYIKYSIQRLGLENGSFTVSIIPVGTGLSSVGPAKTYPSLSLNQFVSDSISFTLAGGLIPTQPVKYILAINNGIFTYADTITKIYGNSTVVLNDPCNNTLNWNAGGWGVSNSKFKFGPGSITDSPTGNYSNNSNKTISLLNNLNLTDAVYAHLQYYTKFELEKNYDKVQILASTNNGSTWSPICGKYETSPASFGGTTPLYDGLQNLFVKEEINLNDYLGQNLLIKFVLTSDNFATKDGFYFDEFLVRKLTSTTSGISFVQKFDGLIIYPNPSSDFVNIENNNDQNYRIKIVNELGLEIINNKNFISENSILKIPISNLAAGIYFVEISNNYNKVIKKIIVTH